MCIRDRFVTGHSDPQALPATVAVVMRAAADFIESAGLRSGVHVICGDGEVRISVWEPFGDIAARSAVVAKLAVLIGGIVRQGQILHAHGDTKLEVGDRIIVFAPTVAEQEVRKALFG